jgi:hypothetical protein
VNIGERQRIIEIKPAELPLPVVLPEPVVAPAPDPVSTPREPVDRRAFDESARASW